MGIAAIGRKLTIGRIERMKLGVDTYSIRSQGWDAFGYLEYSKDRLDIVHFSDMDLLRI